MTGPRISVLCPTRGRPAAVAELVASCADTASGRVEFVFYVDTDDPALTDYGVDRYGPDVRFLAGERRVLSECWNRCAEIAGTDVLMHCGDDIRFRTPGWDGRVLAEFERWPDRLVLVHGRDGLQDGRVATHGFYHRRWTEVFDYFVPPHFASDYNDLWWTEVADAVDRRVYLPDVYTEHLHPSAGKGAWDRTHEERLARHRAQDSDGLYRQLAPERAADAEKLRAAIARAASDGRIS